MCRTLKTRNAFAFKRLFGHSPKVFFDICRAEIQNGEPVKFPLLILLPLWMGS